MKRTVGGRVSPVLLFVVLLAVGAIAADKVFGLLADFRGAARQSAKQSSKKLVNGAEDYIQGKRLASKPSFPDTKEGRVSSAVWDLMHDAQDAQMQLRDGLEKIDYAWLWTGEAMASKNNLQQCLSKLDEADELLAEYDRKMGVSMEKTYRKLSKEAGSDPEGKKAVGRFRKNATGSQSFKMLVRLQSECHEALRASVQFLMPRSGKYKLGEDEDFVFSKALPDRDIEAFNALMDKQDAAWERLIAFQQQQEELAQKKIARARIQTL